MGILKMWTPLVCPVRIHKVKTKLQLLSSYHSAVLWEVVYENIYIFRGYFSFSKRLSKYTYSRVLFLYRKIGKRKFTPYLTELKLALLPISSINEEKPELTQTNSCFRVNLHSWYFQSSPSTILISFIDSTFSVLSLQPLRQNLWAKYKNWRSCCSQENWARDFSFLHFIMHFLPIKQQTDVTLKEKALHVLQIKSFDHRYCCLLGLWNDYETFRNSFSAI